MILKTPHYLLAIVQVFYYYLKNYLLVFLAITSNLVTVISDIVKTSFIKDNIGIKKKYIPNPTPTNANGIEIIPNINIVESIDTLLNVYIGNSSSSFIIAVSLFSASLIVEAFQILKGKIIKYKNIFNQAINAFLIANPSVISFESSAVVPMFSILITPFLIVIIC